MDETSARRQGTDDHSSDETQPGPARVLEDDHVFNVLDRDGNERDVGRLVNALLTLHANEHAKPDDERAHTDLFSRGVEVGMLAAVRELFGEDAGQAFREHCNEIEHLLNRSDGLPS